MIKRLRTSLNKYFYLLNTCQGCGIALDKSNTVERIIRSNGKLIIIQRCYQCDSILMGIE